MQNAGLLRRVGAMVYDALLLFAVLMLATVPFIIAEGGEAVEPRGNLLYQLTLFGVIYAFFVGYWSTRGRTLGMQSWGLQLVTGDDRQPTVREATIRFFAAVLSWLPLGLGFLWQLFDKDKLTWHDRLSGTRTVYIPRQKKQKPDEG